MTITKLVLGPVGTNTLIVPLNKQYSFIVDPANFDAASDNELQSQLDKLETTPIAVILTHGHFDHVSGISYLFNKYQLPILISKEDSIFIGPNSAETQLILLESCYFNQFLPCVSNLPNASGFLTSGASLKNCFDLCDNKPINGSAEYLDAVEQFSKWQIIATPGHSKGSVCIYNSEEKQIICGDTLFDGGYGRTDLYSGSESQIMASIKELHKTFGGQDYYCWSGHGFCGFTI